MISASPMFTFATAAKIVFGIDAAKNLPVEAARLGSRAFLVAGQNPARISALSNALSIPYDIFQVTGEPDVAMVAEGASKAVAAGCDMVISVGGGSVIDAGKAISALISNRRDVMTYLEVIGEGKPLDNAPVPFVAVPTTAGTGAEVTKNAVLSSPAHKVKVSMRSEAMLPDVAIVDPRLTLGVPPDVTAATGLDALTQLIEPYVSKKANPFTDAICEAGIQRAARSLQNAFDDGDNLSAREDMALASLFGGLALANAGLGAVHGFAGPMGGMFAIPHGAICGRLLPFVFKANAAAAENALHSKFTRVAKLLTANPDSTVSDGIRWLDNLCSHLGLRGLSSYNVKETDFDKIISAAQKASSMKGNPVALDDDVLKNILAQAM